VLEVDEVDGAGAAGGAGADFVSAEPVLESGFDPDLESFAASDPASDPAAAGASPPSAFLVPPLPA